MEASTRRFVHTGSRDLLWQCCCGFLCGLSARLCGLFRAHRAVLPFFVESPCRPYLPFACFNCLNISKIALEGFDKMHLPVLAFQAQRVFASELPP